MIPEAYFVNTTGRITLGARAKGSQKTTKSKKLFVLDTCVLLHDPTCLLNFEEHDLFLPLQTLVELDRNKKGHSDTAHNSRFVTRFINDLRIKARKQTKNFNIANGLPLSLARNGTEGLGMLYIQSEDDSIEVGKTVTERFGADNHQWGDLLIIESARSLGKSAFGKNYGAENIIFVTKDINATLRAELSGLPTDDYRTDNVLTDKDHITYTGYEELDLDLLDFEKLAPGDTEGGKDSFAITLPNDKFICRNQFLLQADKGHFIVRDVDQKAGRAVIQRIKRYDRKDAVFGIEAKNREQHFAFNLLMNPNIHIVTLLGQAGSGKTLLALAAGLLQQEREVYNGIIATRITVPVGEDIGFLPGNEEEKMAPWMGALDDNFEVIATASLGISSEQTDEIARLAKKYSRQKPAKNKQGAEAPESEEKQRSFKEIVAELRSKVKLRSMNFMRGRTFQNKYLIIDEAQNLTPKQMKTLISRAGPKTKIVCLGNIRQIDTPYITEQSSGLTYVIERFKGKERFGHVIFAKGERSELAEMAEELL